MSRISSEQLNFVMHELLYWHLELKPVIHGSDMLLKMLHIEKILGLSEGSLINMSLERFVEFGRLHNDVNIRTQFIEGIPDRFWSM